MSKLHPPRYRTTNWPTYNRALERRGSMLILIDPEMTWLAEPAGRMGRPAVFSDAAIQLCLSVKGLFKLPLRQAVGMVRALLKLAGLDWPVPDYSTLCRRQKTLAVQIPYRRADGPLNLLVDSEPLSAIGSRTMARGIKVLGDGEWHARKHGPSRRRQWRKVHLAMDTATSDIRAVEFTCSREGDNPTLPALLDQIPDGEEIGSVTADGAYDTRRCHTAILDHNAKAIIPIRKNGRLWREDCPAAAARNTILRDVREEGRAGWKRRSGYHARSRAEAKMPSPVRLNRWHSPARLKAFGDRIAARDPDRQTAEIHIRCRLRLNRWRLPAPLINRFNALGTADVVRVL